LRRQGIASRSGSGTRPRTVDTTVVTADPEEAVPATRSNPWPCLQIVEGSRPGPEPVPATRLCREWKGVLLADVMRGAAVSALPGEVRHEPTGAGVSAVVLAGPGHRPRGALRRCGLWVAIVGAALVLASAAWWAA